MRPTYSTVDVAKRLGVSVQTVQRWVDAGRLRAWKTLGGHRRIDASDADALFLGFASGQAAPVATAAGASGARRPSVLVVDDKEPDRELAVALIQRVIPTARVLPVASGFEALTTVARQRFDALVTDIVMPHMNGIEMLRHLANDGPSRPHFLLATSNRPLAEMQGMGGVPSGVTLMPKPLGENGFAAWLENCFPGGLRP